MSAHASKNLPRIILSAMFVFVLLGTSFNTLAAPTDEPPGLFIDANVSMQIDSMDDPTVLETRFVTINDEVLAAAEVGSTLRLNLFDDVDFTAILERKEPTFTGGYSWIGNIEGQPLSDVVLVIGDGQMAGNISMPGAFFTIRFAGDQLHAIQRIDQSAFPPEAPPTSVDNSPENLPIYDEQAVMDDGSLIDSLVVYTADARAAAGGTTAMQNLISLAMSETNNSYANSGITQRINIVHTAEVVYTETADIELDRNRLQNPSDGYMDNVHTLRNTYNADVVTLIVHDSGGSYCGIAYIMEVVSTSFENYAFDVVWDDCATGYYSYGHELGHIMSARHDWYMDPTVNSPYSYNHAYLNWQDAWRTVMAYNNECAYHSVNCTRLPYWSNPGVTYGGDPMGVPAGTSTACTYLNPSNPPCDADNHLTLNNTAWTVANFRQSSPPEVGPLEYDSHTIDDDNIGQSSGNNNGVLDCGETVELFVDLYNAGDGTANSVAASISTSDPYVTWPSNTSSAYPNIAGGATATNSDDFEFSIDPGTPNGHVINFDLDISAANGGPWEDSFSIPVSCAVTLDHFVYLPLTMKFTPVVCGDPNEPNNSTGSATPISYGGSLQDPNICPAGDLDYYSFSGTSGDHIGAYLSLNGSALSPYLALIGTDGVSVLTSGTTSLDYQLDASGTYYLLVRSSDHPVSGGPDYTYEITLNTLQGLINGDFELGNGVGWQEFSSYGYQLVRPSNLLPETVPPRSGNWAVWLGGAFGTVSEDYISTIYQEVTIPADNHHLHFWYWIASQDYCNVLYDNGFAVIWTGSTPNIVWAKNLCVDENTGGWVSATVDLSAFIGQTVILDIRAETDSSYNSNLFIDDVSLITP